MTVREFVDASYLAIMGQVAMLSGPAGGIKDAPIEGGLVAGADVGGQQQELAVVGQLKVQLRHRRPAEPPATAALVLGPSLLTLQGSEEGLQPEHACAARGSQVALRRKICEGPLPAGAQIEGSLGSLQEGQKAGVEQLAVSRLSGALLNRPEVERVQDAHQCLRTITKVLEPIWRTIATRQTDGGHGKGELVSCYSMSHFRTLNCTCTLTGFASVGAQEWSPTCRSSRRFVLRPNVGIMQDVKNVLSVDTPCSVTSAWFSNARICNKRTDSEAKNLLQADLFDNA